MMTLIGEDSSGLLQMPDSGPEPEFNLVGVHFHGDHAWSTCRWTRLCRLGSAELSWTPGWRWQRQLCERRSLLMHLPVKRLVAA
jgi:hypothetical protein